MERQESACWAQANSCRKDPETGETLVVGHMGLDLTGTPFALDYEGGFEWVVQGYMMEGEVTRDEGPGRIVEAVGGGDCGGIYPADPPGIILTFWEEEE